jgi:hypothetical protein
MKNFHPFSFCIGCLVGLLVSVLIFAGMRMMGNGNNRFDAGPGGNNRQLIQDEVAPSALGNFPGNRAANPSQDNVNTQDNNALRPGFDSSLPVTPPTSDTGTMGDRPVPPSQN